MKKLSNISVLMLAVIMTAFIATPALAAGKKSAAALPYPTTGAAVLPGGLGADAGEIIFEPKGSSVTVKVLISPGQVTEQKLQNATWNIYASFSYPNPKGKGYILIGSDNHLIGSGKVVDGYVIVDMKIPVGYGNGWYWFRIWGQTDTGQWMYINQSSVYCRFAGVKGVPDPDKPGYEGMTDGKRVDITPKTLDARL